MGAAAGSLGEEDAAEKLRGDLWERLSRALAALKDGQSVYCENRVHPREVSE